MTVGYLFFMAAVCLMLAADLVVGPWAALIVAGFFLLCGSAAVYVGGRRGR